MEDKDRTIQQLKVINQQLMNKIAALEKDKKSLMLANFFNALDIEVLKAMLRGQQAFSNTKKNYEDLTLSDEDKKFMKDMGIEDKKE